MPNLHKVTISFNTHGDNKDGDTVLHVFVKNRSNTSSTPEQAADFISNYLAFRNHEATPWDTNPYLAFAESLAEGVSFDDPSSHTFEIPLRSTPIPLEEIILPMVNVHILPNGNDRWIFSYTVTFLFDDGRSFTASSDTDGVTGVILDQNNRNYSGICAENPFITLPPLPEPQTDAVLTQVTLAFYTHDDNKNDDTRLNVHIANRLSASASQDIAIGLDLLKGQEFPEKSVNTVIFSQTGLPLASNSIRLQGIVLPVVFVDIAPSSSDRWIFDFQITYAFSNGQTFSSRTNGIILDQDNHKYAGVYQGAPFPTVAPPGQAPLNVRDHRIKSKVISLGFLQQKLDELINQRQDPPIWKIFLHNTSNTKTGGTPESYYDFRSIVTNPPPPGFVSYAGYEEGIRYSNNPASLGQFSDGLYFHGINSTKVTVGVDAAQSTPLAVEVDFDCANSGSGIGGWGVKSFQIQIRLTLAVDPTNSMIDVLGWIPGISGDDPGEFAVVRLVTSSAFDLGGFFQKGARQRILDKLRERDPFDGTTLRDRVNATITSWLVGGGCKVRSVAINGDNLEITYTGPENTFEPPVPPGWPSAATRIAAYDFSPGKLANIDHIVVLTMENRSFDHMLGYLSLPPEKAGMGRKDVDGLKGTEFNLLNGNVCPSFALPPGDTIFAPDPPHGYEPVHKAINGGKMDGFVRSYADEHGPTVTPRIMGYQTAASVPVYDALARDFTICHRWFASHPGPTFCNRFFELTGRLNIDSSGFWEFDNSRPMRAVFTPTIFDYLTAQEVSWKYFEHHYCFLRFFASHTFDPSNIVAFDDPVSGFAALAKSGNLPSVSFIDPHFVELPPGGNCDGPPADLKAGQQLVQRVVEAVITSPQWAKTLLIIVYDEHGGFYDHVPPPAAPKVSPESLDTYGVRVPAFVISPWVKGGTVFGHDGIVVGGSGGSAGAAERSAGGPLRSFHFDHTSILKTIARRFMSQHPPYLGARYAAANDLSSVIGDELRPSQFLPFIPYNFLYGASQKRLEVRGAGSAPGTALWQNGPSGTTAQQFSFEDAGDGYYYVRTHTGSLYVTADHPGGVTQEIKYPTDGSATSAHNPDRQRWKFTSHSITVLGSHSYTISNAAFPGTVLQPSGRSTSSGIPVVLGDPETTHGALRTPNAWQVTSPLLPGGGVVSEP